MSKRLTSGLLFLMLVSLGVTNSTSGAPILNCVNGHYYEKVVANGTWDAAKTAAESLSFLGVQGHLATLATQQECDFVNQNNLGDFGWIGAYQPPGSGEPSSGWAWITGETWSYTRWKPGEPSNGGGLSNEDVIQWRSDTPGGVWNDLNRSTSYIGSYIVEYDTQLVDCNSNQVADSCDIAANTSQDCNSNGLPDDCELIGNDCNNNSVPDECDGGTGQDCDANNIPDVCELAGHDCNNNGLLDSCELMSNPATDCDSNGVIDSCEASRAPTIESQPSNLAVTEGGTTSFAVVANGVQPLSYQWRKEGSILDGKTQAFLHIANATLEDAGVYDVRISSPCGQTLSEPATLTVNPANPDPLPIPPDDCGMCGAGSSVSLVSFLAVLLMKGRKLC